MDNSKMTFAAAKTQAQTEILKIFNIENVTLGNSETLDISNSGDGNAVLLAISAILQSDKTEAELTELLSTINTDIRTDGTLDSTTTKATLVTAVDYLKALRSTIRTNIESRYSNLGISATIPAFESYAFKLDTTAPTVSSTSPSSGASASISNLSATFSEVVDDSTLTTSTFTLTDNSSNSVSGTVSSSDNSTAKNTTVTFTPSSLSQGTSTATISNSVKDLNGNPMAQSYSWSFENLGSWELVTSSAPWGNRSEHSVVAYNNKLWLMGGYLSSTRKNDVWYSTDGTNWTETTSSADWSARNDAASLVFDNKIWIFGGRDSSGLKNDVWYSTDGSSWTQATSSAGWSSRNAHRAVVFNNKMWVIAGGRSASNGDTGYKDVWYSTDGANWTRATNSMFDKGRGGIALTTFDNKMWVIGGWAGGCGYSSCSDVWYSTDGSSWTQSTSNLGASSYGHSAASTSSKIWIFGGNYAGSNLSWYSSDGITWASLDFPSGTNQISDSNNVIYDGSIWLAGANKVWKLK